MGDPLRRLPIFHDERATLKTIHVNYWHALAKALAAALAT